MAKESVRFPARLCYSVAAPLLAVAAACSFAPGSESLEESVSLQQINTWGCSDCNGAEQLSGIRSLHVTPAGTVLVADLHAPFVRVWSRGGDPLRFHFYGDSLRYDSEGRLWVRTARGTEGERVFDIFGEGELLDEITVPLPVALKATAFAVAGDYLVVSSPDELGNPRVTLFKVAW